LRRGTAQPAHAADRFAREIIAILGCDIMRSRQLMRKPFGTRGGVSVILFGLDVPNRAS
jgi:hypothetical protein